MRTRKPADRRRAEILEAALDLADERGPDRLTTGAIARAVGLTQAGIFRHFPTKQAIWEAVVAKIAEAMVAGWSDALGRHDRPLARLRGLVESQLRLIQSTSAIPAILFSRELHVENDLLRKALLELMGQFQATLRAEVTEAQDEGMLRPEPDPADVAILLIGLVQGLALRWSLSGRTFSLTEEGARLLDLQLHLLAVPQVDPAERARLA